jgi:hypothetical protein
MRDVASFLASHLYVICAAYVVLFVGGVCARFATGRWGWEIALFVLSVVATPLLWLAMLLPLFGWDPFAAVVIAPQILGLFLLGLGTAWGHWGGDPLLGTPIMGAVLLLSFIINAVGFVWTLGIALSI